MELPQLDQVDILIPGVLLSFYACLFGLVRWQKAQRLGLLKRLHILCWLLLAASIGLFQLTRYSWRGEWFETIPLAGVWLTGALIFTLFRKRLSWPGKCYYGTWFSYPGLLLVAWFSDRIFFALTAVFLVAGLPNGDQYVGPECSLRRTGGLLGACKVAIVVPVAGILEAQYGTVWCEQLPDSVRYVAVRELSSDSVRLAVTSATGVSFLSVSKR